MPTFSSLSLAPWCLVVLLLEGTKQQGLEVDRNFGVTWLDGLVVFTTWIALASGSYGVRGPLGFGPM